MSNQVNVTPLEQRAKWAQQETEHDRKPSDVPCMAIVGGDEESGHRFCKTLPTVCSMRGYRYCEQHFQEFEGDGAIRDAATTAPPAEATPTRTVLIFEGDATGVGRAIAAAEKLVKVVEIDETAVLQTIRKPDPYPVEKTPCMPWNPNAEYKTIGVTCKECGSHTCWIGYLRWEMKAGILLNVKEHYLVQEHEYLGVKKRLLDVANRRMSPPVRKRLDNGDMIRASGDCICDECGFEYRQHDQVAAGNTMILCDGRLVKL